MRHALRWGCFFGAALVGSTAQSETMRLKCEFKVGGVTGGTANVSVDSQKRTVELYQTFPAETMVIRRTERYKDGAYSKVLIDVRIKSLTGQQKEADQVAILAVQQARTHKQSVSVSGGVINVATENFHYRIDMAGGGVGYYGDKGKIICDYAE